MAAAQGYIGRNPADSSTVIARQSFSPTGIQTDFTFAAGYSVGYVDLYLNGARLIEGQDFSATDGSTVGLTTNAVNGDVLEVVAFKAFNATNVTTAAGNFTVGGTLDVTGATTLNAALSVSGNTTVGTGITLDTNGNVNVSGVVTASSFSGDGSSLTGVASTDNIITGTAATFTGPISIGNTISLGDHDRLRFGAGNDLQIYHDGTDSYVQDSRDNGRLRISADIFQVIDKDATEQMLKATVDGAVELNYNGSKKFETTNNGTITTGIATADGFRAGDDEKVVLGTGNDLEIFHDGTHSRIKDVRDSGTLRLQADGFKVIDKDAGETMISAVVDGAVELYHNNLKKFETTSYGAQFTDNVKFDNPDTAGRDLTWEADNDALHWEDNTKATFGAGNDLEIYHDGSNSVIKDNGTGKLILDTDGAAIEFQKQGLETIATFNSDGAVELYHDNNKKFETIGAGVTITGDLNVSGDARIVGVLTVGSSSLVLDGDQGTINGVVHPTSGALSNRNLIINGAMQVAQRGTTVTGIGVDDYTCCDRFKNFASVSGQAGRLTATQETITDLAGFHKALKLQVTTTETPGSTESYGLNTRLEHQDTKGLNIGSSSSIPLTLSFYAKAPTGNGVFCAGICIPGGGSYIEEVTVGTSWSRHEINIPATTNSAHATSQTNDNHSGMEVQITLMAGSSRDGHAGNTWETGTDNRATSNQSNFFSSTSNNLWITGVQLERGEKATPFEHRSFADELDRCYRYYQSSFGLGNVPGTSTDLTDAVITTSWTDGNAPFPQFARPMRTAPSVTLRGRGETTTGQVENGSVDKSASAQQINEKHVGYLAVSSGTGGQFNAFSYVLECDM